MALTIAQNDITTIVAAIMFAWAIQAGAVCAQSLTTEAAATTGVSTEEHTSAAAVQFRGFGELKDGIRFFTEAAWAARSDEVSDVFGAAYPYSNRVQVIEAYGERLFRPRNAVVAVRAGRYRTPFGISNASDHSFEARVVIAVGVLVTASLGAVLAATTQTVTTRSLERASSDLEAARVAFNHLADDRAGFASAQASLVTALPVFRAHMTDARLAGDLATLEALAAEYQRQLKADFISVGDPDGQWTALAGWPPRAAQGDSMRAIIDASTAGRSARELRAHRRSLFPRRIRARALRR